MCPSETEGGEDLFVQHSQGAVTVKLLKQTLHESQKGWREGEKLRNLSPFKETEKGREESVKKKNRAFKELGTRVKKAR